jgi:hypothetical protein
MFLCFYKDDERCGDMLNIYTQILNKDLLEHNKCMFQLQ